MTISYNWLSAYLPETVDPAELERILTSVGLEVESMKNLLESKKKLEGLLIGEVISCEKHPGADKLSLTRISIGNGEPLQVVCGAPNVAAGQKIVLAPPGTTLYPSEGEPFQIKKAKIRGEESHGMICAEDEIGIGTDHAGIMILPSHLASGMPFGDYFIPEPDIIFEIGLTPNRMDAMSHWGVARDVCAYLSHHGNKKLSPVIPEIAEKEFSDKENDFTVELPDSDACKRYCAIKIEGVTVKESPEWLQQRLRSIGLKPLNNIVDVTNFVLHESGQPLHAFDFNKIEGKKIIVKKMPAGTPFITLDGKERKLQDTDLMICHANRPMCIAGVMGGLESSVQSDTSTILLESAWFDPASIRKTSMHHGIRSDAAVRFEKGADISLCGSAIKRAALLIMETGGGKISSSLLDNFPSPPEKKRITFSFEYLRKLSGKRYDPKAVTTLLQSLSFEAEEINKESILLRVPFSKPDISMPCDIVEEVLRMDGLDNIIIPSEITIAPSASKETAADAAKEKLSTMLTANGFYEIFTNSISNSKFYNEEKTVRLLNNLSSELDILRPSMLESFVQAAAFNMHRRQGNLRFFEFGKTYHIRENGNYGENNHLCLLVCGEKTEKGWNNSSAEADYFYLKGIIRNIFGSMGLDEPDYVETENEKLNPSTLLMFGNKPIGSAGSVRSDILRKMDIKSGALWFADIDWDLLSQWAGKKVTFSEIPKYPFVERDLALILDKGINFAQVNQTVHNLQLGQLKSLHLFDIFESEKLGQGKKSVAVRFIFRDNTKTLTDDEVDALMQKLISAFSINLQAEIRK